VVVAVVSGALSSPLVEALTAEESSTAPPSLERSTAKTRLLLFVSLFLEEEEDREAAKGHLPPLATMSSDPGTRGAPLGGGSTGGTRMTAPRCLRAETTATARPLREAAAASAAPAASAQETAAIGSPSSPSPLESSPSAPPPLRLTGSVATALGIVGLVEPGFFFVVVEGQREDGEKVRAPLVGKQSKKKKLFVLYLLQPLEHDVLPGSVDHALLLMDLREPQRGDPGGDGADAGLRRRRRIGVVVGVVSTGSI
jgi:hypothetical protein